MEKFVIVLAAGKGSRIKSRDENHPKAALPILGKALVNYVLDAVKPFDVSRKVVVVGFGKERVMNCVQGIADTVWQHEYLGTGHAVKQAESLLKDKKGLTIVLCGDTPLVTTETIEGLLHKHEKENNALTVVTSVLRDPTGYGRIIRKKPENHVVAIKEDSDCNEDEAYITEVNAGIYVFDNQLLFKYINQLEKNNAQNEYYLTDLVEIFHKNNHKIGSFVVENPIEVFGINDRSQLAYAAKIIQKRVNRSLMLSGVSMEDPDTAYISPDVKIGRDTVIMPNVEILGQSVIGEHNYIGPSVYIKDTNIGNDNRIYFSFLKNTEIGNDQRVEFENRK